MEEAFNVQGSPDGTNPASSSSVVPTARNNSNNAPPTKALNVPKLPTSQFAGTSGASGPPQITPKPIDQLDTHVDAPFCLEQMARVLEQIAERQEDPTWSQTHQALAQQWQQAAQILLEHAVNIMQAQGEVELKQQQLNQNHELHQQTLSQNDQKHVQSMRHTEDQHKQNMKHADATHQFGLKQQASQAQAQQQMTQQKMQTQKTLDKKRVVQASKPKPTNSSSGSTISKRSGRP
jgi:hypothetical protein